MLDRLFPKQFDNNYRGHWLAIWLLVPILLFRVAQSVTVMFDPRYILINADAVPLDSFGAAGAEAVVSLAVLVALSGLVLPLQSIVVLIRYRAMIPFMYLCLLILDVGKRLLLLANPIERSGALSIGFLVNLALLALMLTGLALSLLNKPAAPGRPLSASTR